LALFEEVGRISEEGYGDGAGLLEGVRAEGGEGDEAAGVAPSDFYVVFFDGGVAVGRFRPVDADVAAFDGDLGWLHLSRY